ncbi:MAG: Arylsulfotransferase [Bacteroidetes bacterium]|nr:Arylsulfotransferase [Bacteroidota bacterium]
MRKAFFFLLILFFALHAAAQTATIGLLQQDPASQPGTVLFAPIANKKTYLIDKCGYELHSWMSDYRPGMSADLLEDGILLRAGYTLNPVFSGGGGSGGIIEKIDWNGIVVWSYLISDSMRCLHHDLHALPNGNILALVWEKKTLAEAMAAGRSGGLADDGMWNEKLIELQPVGSDSANIVWEWSAWDHLVQDADSTLPNYGIISAHPERLNINEDPTTVADWIHLNSIDYNPALDQVLISSHSFSEIWIIDHSTSTAQAASHAGGNSGKGGDLLYRWGNPKACHRGTPAERKYFGQHNATWIKPGLSGAGDIMVFNNGKDRPVSDYSSVDIIHPPMDALGNYIIDPVLPFQPDSAYWSYSGTAGFYSNNISGAQRLPNGNTMICNGNGGLFFETDATGTVVWRYKNPVNLAGPATQGSTIYNNNVFRAPFYEQSYVGFSGHALIPGAPVELDPIAYTCDVPLNLENNESPQMLVFPNPFSDEITIGIRAGQFFSAHYIITDIAGRTVMNGIVNSSSLRINSSFLAPGIYLLKLELPQMAVFRIIK